MNKLSFDEVFLERLNIETLSDAFERDAHQLVRCFDNTRFVSILLHVSNHRVFLGVLQEIDSIKIKGSFFERTGRCRMTNEYVRAEIIDLVLYGMLETAH